MLLSWIFRGFLIAAGFVASWFVAKDAPQFGIMQMVVVLILVVSGSGLLLQTDPETRSAYRKSLL